jgi:hypothetical protein
VSEKSAWQDETRSDDLARVVTHCEQRSSENHAEHGDIGTELPEQPGGPPFTPCLWRPCGRAGETELTGVSSHGSNLTPNTMQNRMARNLHHEASGISGATQVPST